MILLIRVRRATHRSSRKNEEFGKKIRDFVLHIEALGKTLGMDRYAACLLLLSDMAAICCLNSSTKRMDFVLDFELPLKTIILFPSEFKD